MILEVAPLQYYLIELGEHEVCLVVTPANALARRLYERLGFGVQE